MGLGTANGHCIVVQNIIEQIGALLVGVHSPTQVNLRDRDTSSAAYQLACVASAEKHLSEHAGPLVAGIIQEIQNRYHIKIGEVRITVNPSEINRSWGGVTCVITQADAAPRRE